MGIPYLECHVQSLWSKLEKVRTGFYYDIKEAILSSSTNEEMLINLFNP